MYPHVRISPFLPREWESALRIPVTESAPNAADPTYWLNGAMALKFFPNGRDALWACLNHLRLRRQDEVLIIKNTDGPYISRCVTETIEKVCRWSQHLSSKTKLVLVIHEFGFPCPLAKILPYKKKGFRY